jgi:hypothetical protein
MRDILYNESISAEDAVLALLGHPINESLAPGDILVLSSEETKDADTGLAIPSGHYSVTCVQDGLIFIVVYNPETRTTGGKEYAIRDRDAFPAISSGQIQVNKHLGEGRYRGTVTAPNELKAMFSKGYLRKKNTSQGTQLEYHPRAFPQYQSGRTNPEHRMNRVRAARKHKTVKPPPPPNQRVK